MGMTFEDPEDEFPPTPERMSRNRQEMYQVSGTIKQFPRPAYQDYKRTPNWRLVISIVALVIIILLGGLGYAYLSNRLRPYTPFTANMKVAQVTVLQTREGQHQLTVQVTRFDANGYQKVDPHPYLIQGDKVELKYEYVTLLDWLGFFGLHSGYILTGLEGFNNDGTPGTSQSLGAADQDQSPLVSPQYSSIIFMPDGKAHPLIMSSTGLHEH